MGVNERRRLHATYARHTTCVFQIVHNCAPAPRCRPSLPKASPICSPNTASRRSLDTCQSSPCSSWENKRIFTLFHAKQSCADSIGISRAWKKGREILNINAKAVHPITRRCESVRIGVGKAVSNAVLALMSCRMFVVTK